MNPLETFDEQQFTEAINVLISYIMNLTSTQHISFRGHDLTEALNINYLKLMEVLNNQSNNLGNAFMDDYVAMASQV